MPLDPPEPELLELPALALPAADFGVLANTEPLKAPPANNPANINTARNFLKLFFIYSFL